MEELKQTLKKQQVKKTVEYTQMRKMLRQIKRMKKI